MEQGTVDLLAREREQAQALAAERKAEQRRRRAIERERAYSSHSGLVTSVALGRWLIRLAARTESNPRARRIRESMLVSHWSRFTNRLLTLPYRS